MAKKNFKWLVIGHIIAIVALVVFLFLMRPKDDRFMSEVMIAVLVLSLITQWLMYKKRPAAFDSKTTVHPDQPE